VFGSPGPWGFFVGKRAIVQFGDPAFFDHAGERLPVAVWLRAFVVDDGR